MVNQQVLAGNWNQVRGKLKEKWGKLSDDDLRSFNGNVDQLVGTIQRKTGEARDTIESFLSDVAEGTSQVTEQMRERFQEGTAQAADAARRGYQTLRHGYEEAERQVQEHPAQSLAVAFGAGIVTGLCLAVMFRARSGNSSGGREHFGRQLRDALSSVMPGRES